MNVPAAIAETLRALPGPAWAPPPVIGAHADTMRDLSLGLLGAAAFLVTRGAARRRSAR